MKKRILAAALVVCLITILACGTLAYFQDQESVQNYFTMTGIEPGPKPGSTPDPDDLFSLALYETDGDEQVDGKTYTDIVPGVDYAKDPTVENTGMYDSYVRVHVELTNAKAWLAACTKHEITDISAYFKGYDETVWSRYADPVYDEDADTLTYTYYLDSKLTGVVYDEEGEVETAGGKATLFTACQIPSMFDVQDMASIAAFQINITADAIQADNTADSTNDTPDAYEAFANWDAQSADIA